MITGYSLLGVGTAGIVTGAFFSTMQPDVELCSQGPCGGGSGHRGPSPFVVVPIVVGSGVSAIGLALGIWGTLKVHGGDEEQATAPSAPRLYAGPGSMHAAWSW